MINERISDRHFRRMFRMSRHCFKLLCQKIISHIGESKFKSEEYIDEFLDTSHNYVTDTAQHRIHRTHAAESGEYVRVEVKLGITLRLLAGGEVLDLGATFNISYDWCKTIAYEVLRD